MDKISFTGFKNVGAIKYHFNSGEMPKIKRMMVELTDTKDCGACGLHLSEFKKLTRKLRYQREDNFLQLDYLLFKEKSPEQKTNMLILVNGNEIKQNPKNIPLLKAIEKLGFEIGNTKKFEVEHNYINSEQCEYNFRQIERFHYRYPQEINTYNIHKNDLNSFGSLFSLAARSFIDTIKKNLN